MDNLIEKISSKKAPNEIMLSLWEDEYYIWIAICLVYGNKMGEQEYIPINKTTKNEFYEKLVEYKAEAYRIKRTVKKNFPAVKVSSCFNWK